METLPSFFENVSDKLRRYSGFIIVLLLAAVIFAPVNVPFSIESVAKALPVRQWILLKSPDGSLSATLHDHRTGLATNTEGFQFDRGDLVHVEFFGTEGGSNFIGAGKTIATITSNRLSEQLVQLRNQLAVEKAGRSVVATGQKRQLVKQLEEEISLAKADLKLRQKILERTKQLYSGGLVALVDLEQAENAYEESEARVRVAEKALTVGNTGEKEETVSLASSKIASLEQQISFLEDKQNRYIIAAPFDGLVRFEITLDGERFLLEDTSATLLLIPIRLRDSRYVTPGMEIEIQLVDNQTTLRSTVLSVSERVEVLNMEQVVIAKASVMQGKEMLPAGMPIRCRIHCGEVRVAEFLKRSIRWQ